MGNQPKSFHQEVDEDCLRDTQRNPGVFTDRVANSDYPYRVTIQDEQSGHQWTFKHRTERLSFLLALEKSAARASRRLLGAGGE